MRRFVFNTRNISLDITSGFYDETEEFVGEITVYKIWTGKNMFGKGLQKRQKVYHRHYKLGEFGPKQVMENLKKYNKEKLYNIFSNFNKRELYFFFIEVFGIEGQFLFKKYADIVN